MKENEVINGSKVENESQVIQKAFNNLNESLIQ
jgi:hypothetical protein